VQLKLEHAKATAGWMSVEELEWLALQASTHYRIAEIGSWQGRSTLALAENTRGIVFAIDTWKGSPEHTPDQIGPEGWLFEQFARNLGGQPVFPIVGHSVDVARHFLNTGSKYFDMIFIDGDHAEESVRADIKAWRPLLQPGGLLCGHDFGTWGRVAETVLEVLGPVSVIADSIWFKEF